LSCGCGDGEAEVAGPSFAVNLRIELSIEAELISISTSFEVCVDARY